MLPEIHPLDVSAIRFPDNVVYFGTIATHIGDDRFNQDLRGLELTMDKVRGLAMVGRQMFVEHYELLEDPAVRGAAVIVAFWIEPTPHGHNAWIAFKLLDSPQRMQLHRDITSGALSCLSISVTTDVEHRETSFVNRPGIQNAATRVMVVMASTDPPREAQCERILAAVRESVDITQPGTETAVINNIKMGPSGGFAKFPAEPQVTSVHLVCAPAWSKYIPPADPKLNRFSMPTAAAAAAAAEEAEQAAKAQEQIDDADNQPDEVMADEGSDEVRQAFDSIRQMDDRQQQRVLHNLVRFAINAKHTRKNRFGEIAEGMSTPALKRRVKEFGERNPFEFGDTQNLFLDVWDDLQQAKSQKRVRQFAFDRNSKAEEVAPARPAKRAKTRGSRIRDLNAQTMADLEGFF